MKKLIKLDASSLNNAGCLRKYYLNHILGYRERGPDNVSLVYGSAFHIFKEVLKKHGDDNLAMRCASNFFKTTEKTYTKNKMFLTAGHLTESMMLYVEKFGTQHEHDNFTSLKDSLGNPLVEQTVSIPYYTDDTIEVLLTGTMDDIGIIKGGCYAIKDLKTTTSWNSTEYFEGYIMSHQLMFYLLIIKWLAEHNPDSIFKEMLNRKVGCAIDGVFLSASKPTEFHTSPVFFYTDDQLSNLEACIMTLIGNLSFCVKSLQDGQLPIREGIINQTCLGRFPGKKCEYLKVCSACDNVVEKHILNQVFTTKEYDPLNFRSIPPEIQKIIDNHHARNTSN